MLTLTRHETSSKGTRGTLTLSGQDWTLHTLEPPWRSDAPDTAIREGVYCVAPHYSAKYGDCFRLFGGTVGTSQGIAHRFAVLIHKGNWHTDSQGCILPGLSKGWDDAKDLPAVWHSGKALAKLRNAIDGPVEMVVRWG